jgi:hypothetical protein
MGNGNNSQSRITIQLGSILGGRGWVGPVIDNIEPKGKN